MDQEGKKTPKLSSCDRLASNHLKESGIKINSNLRKIKENNPLNTNKDFNYCQVLFKNETKHRFTDSNSDKFLINNQLSIENDSRKFQYNINEHYQSTPAFKFNNPAQFNKFFPYNVSNSNDSDQIELIKSFADNIIKKKDDIIECHKTRIDELESQCAFYEHKFSEFNSQSQDEYDIQKLLNENKNLKIHITQLNKLNPLTSSASLLEKQLCSVEYQFDEHKKVCSSQINEKESKIEELNKLLSVESEIKLSLKNELDLSQLKIGKLEKEVQQHILYISDLPTKDQHNDNILLISRLQKENEKQIENTILLNKKLVQISKCNEDYKKTITSLQVENTNQKSIIDSMKNEYDLLNDKYEQKVEIHDLENLKNENDRIKNDYSNHKKAYELRFAQLKEELTKERRKNRDFNKQVICDQATIEALNNNLAIQQQSIEELQQEITKLSEENQSLILHNCHIENELKSMSNLFTPADDQLLQIILKDLQIFINDLEAIVKSISDKVEGHQVDVTSLFGASLSFNLSQQKRPNISRHDLLQNIQIDLKTMRTNINKLQQFILDYLAQDVASKETCTQQ